MTKRDTGYRRLTPAEAKSIGKTYSAKWRVKKGAPISTAISDRQFAQRSGISKEKRTQNLKTIRGRPRYQPGELAERRMTNAWARENVKGINEKDMRILAKYYRLSGHDEGWLAMSDAERREMNRWPERYPGTKFRHVFSGDTK